MNPLIPVFRSSLAIMLGFCLQAVSGAERVALVIGNDAYPGAPLENAAKDAEAIRDMLEGRLGFPKEGIVFGKNLTRTGIYQSLEDFRNRAAGSKLAMVYYAGHGMESLDGKENFLIPVDADLASAARSEALLRGAGVNLTEILSYVEKATAGPKIVLLDCCRDRPAARGAGGLARTGGGLALLPDDQIPADTLILLAAAPSKAASDGDEHGPFTKALLGTLPTPGQSILEAFFAVSDTVQEATQRQQIPWLKFDGSGGIFRTNALVSGNAVPVLTEADLEKRARELAAQMVAQQTSRVTPGTPAVAPLPKPPAMVPVEVIGSASVPAAAPPSAASLQRIASGQWAGSQWNLEESDGEKAELHLLDDGVVEFHRNTVLFRLGTWKQEGKSVIIESGQATLSGQLTNGALAGNGKGAGGQTWTWKAGLR